jgi:hypothetical protein
MTTTTKRKTKAAVSAEYAAYRATLVLRRRAERVVEARGLGFKYQERTAFIERVAKGEIDLTEERTNAEVAAYISTARIHPSCVAHATEYGHLAYRYSDGSFPADRCESCGEPLLCGGVVRNHVFRELSMKEAVEKGRYHGGRCYHVFECTLCGHGSASDSSD